MSSPFWGCFSGDSAGAGADVPEGMAAPFAGGKEAGMGVGIGRGNRFRLFPEGMWLFLFLVVCEAVSLSEALAFEGDRRGRSREGAVAVLSAAEEDKADRLFELVLLKDRAEEGDPEARFELGRRYLQGVGLERNDIMALHWVRAAAEQGYARAQAGLGWMYAVGRGVERDETQSFIWYERAAKEGYPVAQRMLGKCYEKGIGVGKDRAMAKVWYEKAAAQGDEQSVRRLKDWETEAD
ncbi:tetratricopeptide repeat protein [Oxalobacter paraformigenes]|uniref:tetratricopeptide repeat protein n=1 Tax=Oxalobacter paraformigenes TaxID=556268 RepID=UPI001C9D2C33|nr:tetratricopeptide repeat protein [Oxalobacter paraformigenes]